MDYLTYLTTYPHFYQAFSALIERTPNLLRYIREKNLFNSGDSFFSIGAGEGQLELALHNEYGGQCEILEPAALFVENIRTALTSQQLLPENCIIHEQPFEDYVVSQQFDRVLAIHSWYSFGYNAQLLQKALSMVKPGGYLFINIMSKKSPVYGLSNMSYSGGIELCAEDLSDWAAREGFSHSLDWESAVRPASLFFDGDDRLTKQAKDFACFLIAKPWDELSQDEHQQVKDIFLQHRQGDVIPIVSGCLLFQVT